MGTTAVHVNLGSYHPTLSLGTLYIVLMPKNNSDNSNNNLPHNNINFKLVALHALLLSPKTN